jgi:hypothetical protein
LKGAFKGNVGVVARLIIVLLSLMLKTFHIGIRRKYQFGMVGSVLLLSSSCGENQFHAITGSENYGQDSGNYGQDSGNYGQDTGEVNTKQPNRGPDSPVVAISPQTPGTNHVLKCLIVEPSTDPDGDEVTYFYEWSVGGVVSDETTDTLSSEQTVEAEQWTCTVTPTDGKLNGEDSSDSVTIGLAVYGGDITSGLVYDASNCSYCPDNDWYIPDKAFDDLLGTGPESWDAFWTDGQPEWISVDFGIGNERTITRYGLMGSAFHEGYRAKDWELQSSDDEKTWKVLHTVKNAALVYVMYGGEPFTYYTFFNETAYRFYRLHVTANMGGQPYNNAVNIVEIEMMENAAAE